MRGWDAREYETNSFYLRALTVQQAAIQFHKLMKREEQGNMEEMGGPRPCERAGMQIFPEATGATSVVCEAGGWHANKELALFTASYPETLMQKRDLCTTQALLLVGRCASTVLGRDMQVLSVCALCILWDMHTWTNESTRESGIPQGGCDPGAFLDYTPLHENVLLQGRAEGGVVKADPSVL